MAMIYESLWNITQQMLAAAESANWDDLLAFEAKRSGMVGRLQKGLPDSEIEGLEARKEWVHKILIADARISQLTENWMDELQTLMKSIRSERRLINAYGASAPRL